ncbi:MAG: hypothetical protein M0P69_14875 [Bacteroidales bacterium]|nr:hypothetical protein [Bacteroidales bacterium]
MSKETLDPIVDTPNPENDVTETDEIKQIDNPDIDVDAGEDEAKVNDTPKTGNWFDNLSPDWKNNPDVTKYKSLEEYVKSNAEVRKMIGKEKLVLPTKKSTPDEVNAFYEKLGRPKELTGYTEPVIADIPDEIKLTDTMKEQFKAKAFELGLTDKQFQGLYELQANMSINTFNQQVEEAKNIKAKTETALREEYGAAYETKIDNAQKLINMAFAGEKLHPVFSVLANDKGFVKGMAKISEMLGEDVLETTKHSTLTPVEAKKELDAIIGGSSELSKAYFDDLNPEHNAVVDKVISLQQMAEAGK